MSKDFLNTIFDRIVNNQVTESDLSALRKALDAIDHRQLTLQLGKYNVNIGKGKDIHIGDRTYNEWNEEAVKSLIKAVEVNKQAIEALIKALQQPSYIPPQFKSIVDDKTKDFVGREYVFNAINSFIDNNDKGYFTITGDPGQGKSAILAKYVQETKCIAHFNQLLQGPNRADQFLESICSQLIDRYQLPYEPLPSNAKQDGTVLGELLDEVAQKRKGEKIIIAVDALDEVDTNSYQDTANTLYLPANLPDGVYFILTVRRDFPVSLTSEAPIEPLSLLDKKYKTDSE